MTKGNQKLELFVQKRVIMGKKVKSLRNSGYIPAVLYGKSQEAIPLQIPVKDFQKIFKEAGESTLVYVNVEKQSYPTLIHDVSRDGLSGDVIHADFYKVSLTEKIKTKVPVVFDGVAPAVTELKGIFVRNINELEVEAFPQDLPHEIKVDITSLKQFGDQVLVKDVKLGDKVKVLADEEAILALVQQPKSQEELDAELAAPTGGVEDVEIIKKEKVEEPAEEGASSPAATPSPTKTKEKTA